MSLCGSYPFIILIGVFLDQLSKWIAERWLRETVTVIPHLLEFPLVRNYGAAYGMFQHQRIFLLGVSLAVMIGCYIFRHALAQSKSGKWGLSFLYIGAIGNFIDRLFKGYVVDFIDIQIFPVFNLADMCIDAGVLLLIIDHFKTGDRTQTQQK